jgi:uncharacterized protein (DUF1800 family)
MPARLFAPLDHPPFAQARACTRRIQHGVVAAFIVALSACGGGGGGTADKGQTDNTAVSAGMIPSNNAEAYRFLSQATFGPVAADVDRIKVVGYSNWIDEQFALQLQTTHLATVEASATVSAETTPSAIDVNMSWWTHALRDPAQLRQRVAFALSEIFVVSTMTVDNGRMVASYMDMLTTHADAHYRDLLEAVALHPAMGTYLSHMSNRKEDTSTGRVPDENFAREVMQLFSIGLYELDDAGLPKSTGGQYTETYNADDIKGMAKVFTGWSWDWTWKWSALPDSNWWLCFWRNADCKATSQETTRMAGYKGEHDASTTPFTVLGVTIPVQSTPKPEERLKLALDRLATHPNTAPFISRQLIQRLVTSNPSDAYVRDITAVFRSSNGHIGQVVKAILLHAEARQAPDTSLAPTYGKLKEPLLWLSAVLRAVPHSSITYEARAAAGQLPYYASADTSDAGNGGVGQSPMRAPSVFNFFRPGYKQAQSAMALQDKVSPEMQITSESSVIGHVNYLSSVLNNGWGQYLSASQKNDVQFDFSQWDSTASEPASLIKAISQQLTGTTLPSDVQDEAVAALTSMPAGTTAQKRLRVKAALLLTAMSPSFVVQQ